MASYTFASILNSLLIIKVSYLISNLSGIVIACGWFDHQMLPNVS